MSSGSVAPPRVAGWLLDFFDPEGIVRGDLDEEFSRFRLTSQGRVRATVWYWLQTLRTLPRLVSRRMASGPFPLGRGLVSDFGQALRSLRRRPGFASLTVLTFALALGANTAVFSLVNSVLLRPLPFANEDRLVRIHPDELFYIQMADAEALADEARSIETGLPWARTLFTFTESDPAEEVRGAYVPWNHFEALGAPPAVGRTFRESDGEMVPTGAVILAHTLWIRRFGADRSVVGRQVEIGGRSRTIVGVMGSNHVPMESDWEAWSPLPLDAERMAGVPMAMNALLRPGVSVAQAQADVRATFAVRWDQRGEATTPEELAAIRVIPIREHLLGSVTRPLQILMGAVGFVLLLACANVANLLMAQGGRRAPEIAVRASLGAGRGRILRQLLLESGALAAAGAVVGLVMSWLLHAWGASRLPADLPRAGQWEIDRATFLFTAITALLAALLAGALPSWRTASGARSARTARGGDARSAHRMSATLVAAEVAASVLLVVGAGLMLRSFTALRAVDPGFEAEGLVSVRVTPPSALYTDTDGLMGLYDQILERAAAVPGVRSAGGIMFLPMTPGGAWSMFRVAGEGSESAGDESPRTALRVVTPQYFETMGIPLLAGRALTSADHHENVQVVLINEALAGSAFGPSDPVGRTLLLGRGSVDTVQVVGVVGDVRQAHLREQAVPELYRPLGQSPWARMFVVARTEGDPAGGLAALQRVILAVDDGVVLSRPGLVEDVVSASLAETRLVAQLLSLFGIVALLLGAIGVYGVTANSVARRTREIGVRLALGAAGGRVARQTILSGMVPVAIGLAAGIAGALTLSNLMQSLLFTVGPRDVVTFAAAPAILGLVAVASLVIPALRASRVDPVRALRGD